MSTHTPADFAVVDDFNRSDQTPPGPLWTAGPHIWTDNSAGLRTLSNQLAPASTGTWRDAHLSASYARPVICGFTVPTVASAGGLTFVWLCDTVGTASPSGYTIRINQGTDWQIQRYVAGGATFLAGSAQVLSAGHKVALLADDDDTISSWVNTGSGWTKVDEFTDSGASKRAGPFYPGLETNSGSIRLDDMIAGNVAAAPAGPPRGSLALLGVGR